jgi:hypothetical protein
MPNSNEESTIMYYVMTDIMGRAVRSWFSTGLGGREDG